MPSKKSKPSAKLPFLWKAERGCSELKLEKIAQELASGLGPVDRVWLEGPLGAGKSTFARALLRALGIQRLAEGSPTFALVHEYQVPLGQVIHTDLYRFKSETEIEEAGVLACFWECDALVLCEWVSLWPGFEASVAQSGQAHWRVEIELEGEQTRSVRITRLRSSRSTPGRAGARKRRS